MIAESNGVGGCFVFNSGCAVVQALGPATAAASGRREGAFGHLGRWPAPASRSAVRRVGRGAREIVRGTANPTPVPSDTLSVHCVLPQFLLGVIFPPPPMWTGFPPVGHADLPPPPPPTPFGPRRGARLIPPTEYSLPQVLSSLSPPPSGDMGARSSFVCQKNIDHRQPQMLSLIYG